MDMLHVYVGFCLNRCKMQLNKGSLHNNEYAYLPAVTRLGHLQCTCLVGRHPEVEGLGTIPCATVRGYMICATVEVQ